VVNDVPPKDRDVAMVFQSYALYPHMTVRENLEFGLRIRKTPRAEIDRLVPDAAQVLGIQQLMERKPKELSGGQRQRVALGRAIVRKPSVFLFDEPLSNLDAKLRVEVRAEIKKLQARLQVTTVYVTHDQVEAMTMGHRIAILNAGKLQQVGAPLEVYEKPANLFAAGFIGTPPMNLLRATLGPGGNTARAAGFEMPVPSAARGSAGEGRKVVLGIRPENVVPPGREARGATHRLALTVEIIEVPRRRGGDPRPGGRRNTAGVQAGPRTAPPAVGPWSRSSSSSIAAPSSTRRASAVWGPEPETVT
jgi:multiple sugar transport system ATP-binding protein